MTPTITRTNRFPSHPNYISQEAWNIAKDTDIIDLHIDTFIPPRLFGYDISKEHKNWFLGRHFFTHLDIPRIRKNHLNGAMWSITTNPFRFEGSRWTIFRKNLDHLRKLCSSSDEMMWVTNYKQYQQSQQEKKHACIPSIQGGNAISGGMSFLEDIATDITRITLIHLTNSIYGATSSPDHLFRWNKGLSTIGKDFVALLNEHRIFVDLAHIHPKGFWDAIEIHNKDLPVIVTHTGVDGVNKHWRNLDDQQLKAIVDFDGVIGVIFAENFLQGKGTPKDARMIISHMEHIISVVGEDAVAIGTDLDGAIRPPRDIFIDPYPRLIQLMLDKKWSMDRIRKILGQNALRCLQRLRPE
jgi:membrane dipeptidase